MEYTQREECGEGVRERGRSSLTAIVKEEGRGDEAAPLPPT